MKAFLKKLFQKLIQRIVRIFVSAEEDAPVSDQDPELAEGTEAAEGTEGVAEVRSKKAIWKFVIQTLISILTAILTALGATSCVTQLM
ncbi:MAG: smalltalk protein [Prevotella sp.]|nr:smalltalk protein [Prevotella sp.]